MTFEEWGSPEAVNLYRPVEAEAVQLIRDGFRAQLDKEILGEDPARLSVRMEITDLHPGSRGLRLWFGFGAGRGYVNARVIVGRQSFMIRRLIYSGSGGGDFNDCLKALGAETCHHVARLIRGDETQARQSEDEN
jgi:hypothetical protein